MILSQGKSFFQATQVPQNAQQRALQYIVWAELIQMPGMGIVLQYFNIFYDRTAEWQRCENWAVENNDCNKLNRTNIIIVIF